jgi:hypothetical protein
MRKVKGNNSAKNKRTETKLPVKSLEKVPNSVFSLCSPTQKTPGGHSILSMHVLMVPSYVLR